MEEPASRDGESEPSPAAPHETRVRSWFDWWFRDRRTGGITIAQFPNVALGIFLVTVAVATVAPVDGAVASTLHWIGLAALGWWSLDELLRGVNPWRRLLGLGGCGFTAAGVVATLA